MYASMLGIQIQVRLFAIKKVYGVLHCNDIAIVGVVAEKIDQQ